MTVNENKGKREREKNTGNTHRHRLYLTLLIFRVICTSRTKDERIKTSENDERRKKQGYVRVCTYAQAHKHTSLQGENCANIVSPYC